VSARRSKANVLIVEDDAQLRGLYRNALAAAGFAAVAVPDGLAALQYVAYVREPDAVLLDLGLPGVHGRDVYRELSASASTSRIPIIVVTGEPPGSFDDRDFACVLRKPINIDTLLDSVRKCLRKAAL
jgi:two-component system KDP operon response regulator KdpE